MLDELADGLPPRVKDAILQPAEGNPFFVEEVMQSWIDRGVLHRSENGSTAVDLPRRVDLPETVQAVIAARIDLLPALEKSALQAASVVGRTFWEGAVRELLAAATPRFGLLEERDFVRRRRRSALEPEREYLFKHELTRDVAYRSLPAPRRAGCMRASPSGSSAATPAAAGTPRCWRTTMPRRWTLSQPRSCGVRTRPPAQSSAPAPSAGHGAPASRRGTVTR